MDADRLLINNLKTLIAITFVIGQSHKKPMWAGVEHQGEGRVMYHFIKNGEIQSSSPNKTLMIAVFRQNVAEMLEEAT